MGGNKNSIIIKSVLIKYLNIEVSSPIQFKINNTMLISNKMES